MCARERERVRERVRERCNAIVRFWPICAENRDFLLQGKRRISA